MADSIHHKYLAVSPADYLWGLAVNSVGCQEVLSGESYPPQKHPSRYLFTREHGRILDEYQLLYITSGKGTFKSATCPQIRHLQKGSLFLLFPGEWHSYAPYLETGWKEYWIGFTGTQMETWMSNGFFSRLQPVWNIGLQNEVIDLYREAIAIADRQQSGFQQRLGGIVSHLLSLAWFYGRNATFSESKQQINRAKIIIAEQYKTICPEDVASKICMGYNNFRRVFKDYTGFSPAKYIQMIRLNRVKEALTNSDLPARQIAFEAGYENEDYFFTLFHHHTGMTPLEYRSFTRGQLPKQ